MTEEIKSQPAYTPPRVMRLGEVRAGAGWCGVPGSGDATDCGTGNNAGTWCLWPGSTATGACWGGGNAAGAACLAAGSGF